MSMTMTSPIPLFRNFSNKENGTFSPPPTFSTPSAGPSTHKPRINGVGKAPKRPTGTRGSKPYDRRSSTAQPKLKKSIAPAKGLKKAGPVLAPIITTTPVHQPIQPQVRIATIPVRLPRPQIPPVRSLPGEMSHIPIDWALPRLRLHFPALLTVSSQYHPQPESTSTTNPPSFAFAIPQLLTGGESTSELEAKVKGREPDVCLAIKGQGRESGPARLLPVNSLVYASQCSFWPKATSSASLPSTSDSDPSVTPLPSINEESSSSSEEQESDESGGSDSDTTIKSAPSLASSTSSTTSPHILHLPLLSLTIPHPPSFPIIHTHLHFPTRSLIPSLLALPPTCLTPGEIKAELEKMGLNMLMQKLEYMHGFWANLCSLGVTSEGTWKGRGEAWGLVIDVVAERVKTPQAAKAE